MHFSHFKQVGWPQAGWTPDSQVVVVKPADDIHVTDVMLLDQWGKMEWIFFCHSNSDG